MNIPRLGHAAGAFTILLGVLCVGILPANAQTGTRASGEPADFSLSEMAAWLGPTIRSHGFTPQANSAIMNRLVWEQTGCDVTYISTTTMGGDRAELTLTFSLGDVTGVRLDVADRDGPGIYLTTPESWVDGRIEAWQGGRRVVNEARQFSSAKFHLPRRADAERAAALIEKAGEVCS